MFWGETAKSLETRLKVVWADRAFATIGASEGTLQRASQPSIIMHPDSAMPTGPSRTQITRIASVATRKPLMNGEYPVAPPRSQVLAPETSRSYARAAKRPPGQIAGGLPARRSSNLRELARLNQINQHVPLVVGEDRKIPGLTDPDLLSRELHFRAGTATERAQQYFPVVQCIHLLPLTIFSLSM